MTSFRFLQPAMGYKSLLIHQRARKSLTKP